jgi:hypothetical protein
MKTSNVNQGRIHNEAIIRGWVSNERAGSTGITITDGDGNTVTNIWNLILSGATITVNGDGTVTIVVNATNTVVGTLTPDGSPFTISSGADHRSGPGAAWLTNPTATVHGVGDTFLIVYRHAASHLTGGKIVGKIATITDTSPWTYTLGSQFDIEDLANDLRPQGESLSVLDIGGGDYRPVIWADEFDGTANMLPHVLICDDSSATMTSGSTWTRHNVGAPFSGHTQDAANGRVHQLSDGTYMMAGQHYAGATQTPCVLSTSDITDWSSPTMVDIAASGYNEVDFEEVAPGTLVAHMRNSAETFHYSSTSFDYGATWSTPVQLYAAMGYPVWRVLTSGIGLTVYRSQDGSRDTAWRQTQSGAADSGWGSETILDSRAGHSIYATILQLDDNHVLVIYAVEDDLSDPVDADIYSQVFTDSTVFGTTGISGITVQDEGVALSELATALNFVGSGVTATGTGAAKTITIPGGGAAADITIADAGGYFTGTDVEAALQELGADVTALPASFYQHAHVASETHLSDGSTGTYTLDQGFEPGSVIAWNVTTIARLTVTETAPDQATVSPVGTSGDSIVFDYAATIA